MTERFLEIAMTPGVRAMQKEMGTDAAWSRIGDTGACDRLTATESAFIAARDSFYLATVSDTGWPYVQHRGGPPGFLKTLDDRTLAFANYRGNRQYISVGNTASEDRACLFLMDYAHRARLKLYVRVETVLPDAEPELLNRVREPGYRAVIDRIFRLRLAALDWNCPQHIRPRFTEEEIAGVIRPLQQRLAALESENARLRARLDNTGE